MSGEPVHPPWTRCEKCGCEYAYCASCPRCRREQAARSPTASSAVLDLCRRLAAREAEELEQRVCPECGHIRPFHLRECGAGAGREGAIRVDAVAGGRELVTRSPEHHASDWCPECADHHAPGTPHVAPAKTATGEELERAEAADVARFLRELSSVEGEITPEGARWAREEAQKALEGLEAGVRSEFDDWSGRSGVGEGLMRPSAILVIGELVDGVLAAVQREREAVKAGGEALQAELRRPEGKKSEGAC